MEVSSDRDQRRRGVTEHQAILDAIIGRKPDAAERLMREHIRRTRETLALKLGRRPTRGCDGFGRRSWLGLRCKRHTQRSRKGQIPYCGPARNATGPVRATASPERTTLVSNPMVGQDLACSTMQTSAEP